MGNGRQDFIAAIPLLLTNIFKPVILKQFHAGANR
jgi:hypothetical protein